MLLEIAQRVIIFIGFVFFCMGSWSIIVNNEMLLWIQYSELGPSVRLYTVSFLAILTGMAISFVRHEK